MVYAGDVDKLEGILDILQKFADNAGITDRNDKDMYVDALTSANVISTSTEKGRITARKLIAEVTYEAIVNGGPAAAIQAGEDLFTGSTKADYHSVVYGPNITTNLSVLDNRKTAVCSVEYSPTRGRKL